MPNTGHWYVALARREPADQPGPAHHGPRPDPQPSEGRDYYDRKKADGKAPMEAMRCVKRRLSDIVFQQMLNDAVAHTLAKTATGPGGQRGNDSDSSATDSHPNAGSSDKPLPGPATSQPKTPLRKAG